MFITKFLICRYNGGEGFVPGSMFRKFDRRQGSDYVKGVRRMPLINAVIYRIVLGVALAVVE